MGEFEIKTEHLELPKGAFARGYRRMVWRHGKPIVGFTQGPSRAYLYPVYTPEGFVVTTESPADHPHHNSVWIASDHLHCLMPIADDRYEEATYCFYVNETFQGRAPGRIEELGCEAQEESADHYRVVQHLHWRGPNEWGAPDGRIVAVETRTTDIYAAEPAYRIEIRSCLEPTHWDFRLGPTRHAYFGVRVADSIRVLSGGSVISSDGRIGGQDITGTISDWLDYSGPVGGGRTAGLAIVPCSNAGSGPWFVTDWGTIAVNPFQHHGKIVRCGEALELGVLLMVHDGDVNSAEIPTLVRRYANVENDTAKNKELP